MSVQVYTLGEAREVLRALERGSWEYTITYDTHTGVISIRAWKSQV